MAAWTAPATGSYHFAPAPGEPPHHVNQCTDACDRPDRQGWIAWVAKDTAADPDDDPAWRPGG